MSPRQTGRQVPCRGMTRAPARESRALLGLMPRVESAVARILNDLNNKNPELDTGVNAEISEKQNSQPLFLTSMKSSD